MTGNISLVEAAILQANLLQILETNNADEAASKLPVVEARLDLLREDMAKQSAVITSIDQELFARAKKEKSISSSFKRMSFKVKRKSVGDDAKAKAEQEMANLNQRKEIASNTRKAMFEQLKAAEGEKKEHVATVKKHEDAVKELDALYESAFSGPTPQLPREDELEAKVAACQKRTSELDHQTKKKKQVYAYTADAERRLADIRQCFNAVGEAIATEFGPDPPKGVELERLQLHQYYQLDLCQKYMQQVITQYLQAAILANDNNVLPIAPFEGDPIKHPTEEMKAVPQDAPDKATKFLKIIEGMFSTICTRLEPIFKRQKQEWDNIREIDVQAIQELREARKELVNLRRAYLIELSEKHD